MPTPEQLKNSQAIAETRQRLATAELLHSLALKQAMLTGDFTEFSTISAQVNTLYIEYVKRRAGTWKNQ